MKKQYTKKQIQEAINYWQKQLDMMDKIDESKIADYFGKLFKTKSWVQKQQKLQDELKKQQDELKKQQDELKKQQDELKKQQDEEAKKEYERKRQEYERERQELIKKYPLAALVDKIKPELKGTSVMFCQDGQKQFIAFRQDNLDDYEHRFDTIAADKKYILAAVEKHGLKSNYTFTPIDRNYAVLNVDDPNDIIIQESENDFKKIDDIVTYLKDKKLKWIKVVKFQRLNAYQSKGGEEIETVGSDGNIETKRKTKSGDWVVNNVSNKDNKWIIDDKTFKKKYEEEKDGVYKPKGGSMLAAKVSDCEDVGVEFAPPNWGGDFIKIKNDGWFMKDPSNEKDIYAISKEDFDLTYKKA